MVIVRISFVCALVRACVEPRGAPNRANESALRNSRAYTQSSLFAKPHLEKVKTKRENPGESKVINNFPSSHCRAMWCRSIRIYAKKRENCSLPRREPKMLEISEDSGDSETVWTDRRWIRKKMKITIKKKRKKKMKNRVIINGGG